MRKNETREVIQYHYTEWPDHGVPLEASTLAHMTNLLRSEHRFGPTVIHCSAGIGRTGCLLLVLMCLEDVESATPLKVKDALLKLRNFRANLVQNLSQYQFAHYLLWAMLFEGDITCPPEGFEAGYRRLVSGENSNTFARQFQWLKKLPNELTYIAAKSKNLPHGYNRFKNVLAADSRRIYLSSLGSSIEDQYLNAIAVDGFRCKNAYIVTEHPTTYTLERIWLMILERNLQIWILLNQMAPNDQDFPSVIPDQGTSEHFHLVSVKSLGCSGRHEFFEENFVEVVSRLPNKAHTSVVCCIIQFYGWPYPTIGPETGAQPLFEMLDYIHSKGPFDFPLLFTCADGFTACGATLALDIASQRAEALEEVCVLSACVEICFSRPQFIVSLEQFLMLFESMRSFLGRRDQHIYENVDVFCEEACPSDDN